jgi:hypothetical protein
LGNAAAVPHVTPDANVTKAKLNTDQKGSFRVRAYIDCNGSNTYDDQIDLEPSIPLNLVLADATVVTDNSVAAGPFPATVGQAGGGVEIANGVWTFGSAGMNMELIADVTGGGNNGLLGLDCIFSGLVNNLTNVDISGGYTDSTTNPATPHSLKSVYVSNATAGTGAHRGRKLFKPGDPAPTAVAWPILDSGRSPAGGGGETATMSGSGPHTVTPRPVGQRWKIQCLDAPSRGFPKVHPNFPNAILSSIHLLWQFSANFCFWTNITKSRAATGDPADRLYSVLRIVNWQLAGDWTVAYPAAPAPNVANLTVVTQHAATTPSRSTVNPIGRAQDNNVEVRPPSGIAQIMAWDGSN